MDTSVQCAADKRYSDARHAVAARERRRADTRHAVGYSNARQTATTTERFTTDTGHA